MHFIGNSGEPHIKTEYVCCLAPGMNAESWGLSYKGVLCHNGKSKKYTEPFYEINTVIGVLLDCNAGTIIFYRNGENLSLAFSDLNQVRQDVCTVCNSHGRYH